jgi:putative membrane protein insertion efficiency factor
MKILLFFLRLYRLVIGSLLGSCCRFYPSCSHYAEEAFLKYGFWKGSYLTVKRVVKCFPWHPGGYDPP